VGREKEENRKTGKQEKNRTKGKQKTISLLYVNE
jgi:hypothetical protein